tara:strand:- start:277 stop:483 length:207 start_codon:yes stop_codon:yes gene_type:complete
MTKDELLNEHYVMMVQIVRLKEENRVLKEVTIKMLREDKKMLEKAVSSLHRRIDVLKKMLKWRKERNG